VINIDMQRVAAVRKLEELGYSYRDGEWAIPAATAPQRHLTAETDAMHSALVRRADVLEGCPKGSVEEAELKVIVDAIYSKPTKQNAGRSAKSRAVDRDGQSPTRRTPNYTHATLVHAAHPAKTTPGDNGSRRRWRSHSTEIAGGAAQDADRLAYRNCCG